MPIQILMPALSPTMTDGTLAKWHKKEGDAVESGDVIAEIETDKATMEVEAADEGTMGRILIAEGTEGVPVNQVIALLLEDGEDASALEGAEKAATAPTPAPAAPAPAAPAPAPTPAPGPAAPATAAAAPPPAPVPAPPLPPGAPPGVRLIASPLARRLAAERGFDISRITGTGPHGRIVKRDIESAAPDMGAPMPSQAAGAPPPPGPAPAPIQPPPPRVSTGLAQSHQEIPHSTVRRVVAQRLTESKQQVPHFYLSIDCQLDKLLALRRDLNAKSPDGAGAYKLSVNDFVIRAAALALLRVPAANATWTENAILQYSRPDISVAVAIDGGLITPVIENAAGKGLLDISTEMKGLAARARAGQLQPEEYQGGTFTISNLGMYGIREFAAIINPPQGAILAVGAGEERAIVRNGALAIASVMTCTLSVDHRVVDGAVGAEFMAAFKALMEDPVDILL